RRFFPSARLFRSVRLPPSARPEARNFCTGGVVARWSPRLSPNDQSLDQRLRQVGEPHAFLHRGNIVGNPPKFHHVVRQISNCESSSRIPVARLSEIGRASCRERGEVWVAAGGR